MLLGLLWVSAGFWRGLREVSGWVGGQGAILVKIGQRFITPPDRQTLSRFLT
jgi:hypothetical protein